MPTYTTEQYNSLTAAIATGAREVQYSDKKIRYGSLSEMLQLKKQMEDDLGLTPSNLKRYGKRLATHKKGL